LYLSDIWGIYKIHAQEIPEFTKLFDSILTTSGEFKVSLSKQNVSSILITESFKNLTFGGELNENGMQYYFELEKPSSALSEIEFFHVTKFLSKIIHR
jgi:hypothetical protein